jgi:hypothetical protein
MPTIFENFNLSNTKRLTKKERLALIRYCIMVSQKFTCKTDALLRPFNMLYLQEALKEKEESIHKHIEYYNTILSLLQSGSLNESQDMEFLKYTVPEGEDIEAYYNSQILIEEEEFNKKDYFIHVNYSDISEEDLNFHFSLSPKVTFGANRTLHEYIAAELTDQLREKFINGFLDDNTESASYGNFIKGGLSYVDFTFGVAECNYVSTDTELKNFLINLPDELLQEFIYFEGQQERNKKIIEKLQN